MSTQAEAKREAEEAAAREAKAQAEAAEAARAEEEAKRLAEEAAAREAAAQKAAEEAALAEEQAKREAEAAAAREAKAQEEAAEAARKLEELKRQEADAARIVKACAEIKCRAPHAIDATSSPLDNLTHWFPHRLRPRPWPEKLLRRNVRPKKRPTRPTASLPRKRKPVWKMNQ